MGIEAEPLEEENEEVINSEHAELILCALQHKRKYSPLLTDPYFTEEEWQRVHEENRELLEEAKRLLQTEVPSH